MREFLDALPGYLLPDEASQARMPTLLARLKEIAEAARSTPGALKTQMWKEAFEGSTGIETITLSDGFGLMGLTRTIKQ